MAGDPGEKDPRLLRRQALNIWTNTTRRIGERGGVAGYEAMFERTTERTTKNRSEILTRPRRQPSLPLLLQKLFHVAGLDPREPQVAEARRQMKPHKLRVAVMGLWANARLDDDCQPLIKVGTECLPVVAQRNALLNVPKRLRELGGNVLAGPTVEGFSPTATTLPPKIRSGLPATVG